MDFKLQALVLLTIGVSSTIALRCYTCDNLGSGDECITNPASIAGGSSLCLAPNDEYCYTSRLEEPGEEITFNRGCCRVKEGSPVCPIGNGENFQVIENTDPPYTKYLTRCDGDLCNDGEGLGSGPGAGGSGGVLIVEGKRPKHVKSSAGKLNCDLLIWAIASLLIIKQSF